MTNDTEQHTIEESHEEDDDDDDEESDDGEEAESSLSDYAVKEKRSKRTQDPSARVSSVPAQPTRTLKHGRSEPVEPSGKAPELIK